MANATCNYRSRPTANFCCQVLISRLVRSQPYASEGVHAVTRHSKVLSTDCAYIVADGRRLPKLVCNSRQSTSELSPASSDAQ